jgi:hypothetical protein
MYLKNRFYVVMSMLCALISANCTQAYPYAIRRTFVPVLVASPVPTVTVQPLWHTYPVIYRPIVRPVMRNYVIGAGFNLPFGHFQFNIGK